MLCFALFQWLCSCLCSVSPGIQVLSWPHCLLLSQVAWAGVLLRAGEVQGSQNLGQSLPGLLGAGVVQLLSVPWHVPGMG